MTAANGVLLANLQEGKTIDFTPDSRTGCSDNRHRLPGKLER